MKIVEVDNIRGNFFILFISLRVDIFASGLSESKMRVHRTFGYLCHFEPMRIISDLLCSDLAHAI